MQLDQYELAPLIMPALGRAYQQFLVGFSPEEAVQLQSFLQRMLANGH